MKPIVNPHRLVPLGVAALALLFPSDSLLADFNVALLHSFPSNGSEGLTLSGLATDGINLYGQSQRGGASSNGTIYSMHPDGTAFTVLHSFSGPFSSNLAGQPRLTLSS